MFLSSFHFLPFCLLLSHFLGYFQVFVILCINLLPILETIYTSFLTLVLFTFCTCCILRCLVCIVVSCLVYIVVLCVLLSRVYCCHLKCICCTMCVYCCFFTLDAGLLARSQYSEVPATGHLDTGFSWFFCVYKQMLRWFPKFQFATTCFSYSPPDLNLLVTNFIFCVHVK